MKEGPLDMRMNPEQDLSAKELVNKASEEKLGEILRTYGEERQWRKMAKAIVEARRKKPIETTRELAEILVAALGFKGRGKLHPATLAFQALRIAVNNELGNLETALTKALHFLASQGRMGVIAFHSLEDRIVKNLFRSASLRKKGEEKSRLFELLTKKPLVPALAEVCSNSRSRSAKMRFISKV